MDINNQENMKCLETLRCKIKSKVVSFKITSKLQLQLDAKKIL